MEGFLNDVGGWLIGLAVVGVVLLVGNGFLRLKHRLTKGKRTIWSFQLICHADDAPVWRGRRTSADGTVTLNIDELVAQIFSRSSAVSVSNLVKDRQGARRSSILVIPSGQQIAGREEAVRYAFAAARSGLSEKERETAQAVAVHSAESGLRSYVVMIGNFPGNAPTLTWESD